MILLFSLVTGLFHVTIDAIYLRIVKIFQRRVKTKRSLDNKLCRCISNHKTNLTVLCSHRTFLTEGRHQMTSRIEGVDFSLMSYPLIVPCTLKSLYLYPIAVTYGTWINSLRHRRYNNLSKWCQYSTK